MELFERVAGSVRHSPLLRRAGWLWSTVRPWYNRAIETVNSEGLARNMNGTDKLVLTPKMRGFPEFYEPDVWPLLMREIRPGDTFVDVGTCFAIYAVAVGLRLNGQGRVVAFEPDGANCQLAEENIRLNNLNAIAELRRAAVSDTVGVVHFAAGHGTVSHIIEKEVSGTVEVKCVTLDGCFPAPQRVDVMKIDVEGYEEPVLRGARELLSDMQRGPRVIFLEVHPFAWEGVGTTSDSLLAVLAECGYETQELDGRPVSRITEYGEVIARRRNG